MEAYEVRYGPTVKNMGMLTMSLVLTAGCFLPEVPLLVRVAGGVLFGAASLLFAAFMVLRLVAFRVDSVGITIAGNPLRYRGTLLHVPWTEVQAVVLWKQHSAADMPYVGVRRYKDSPPQRLGKTHKAVLRATVPHVPADVVQFSRAVNGWRLDRERLASAVAHFAPHVTIVDAG